MSHMKWIVSCRDFKRLLKSIIRSISYDIMKNSLSYLCISIGPIFELKV